MFGSVLVRGTPFPPFDLVIRSSPPVTGMPSAFSSLPLPATLTFFRPIVAARYRMASPMSGFLSSLTNTYEEGIAGVGNITQKHPIL